MIPIRPEVAMYAAFARLNYKPWYALAEFVDNSIQSAIANRDKLVEINGNEYTLNVDISIEDDHIEIRDNAGGIAQGDYNRAFRPAAPPPDTSGLSEFGLGLKAAASWFSQHWSVRTKALDEDAERTIEFDIPTIVRDNVDSLQPTSVAVDTGSHYTTLRLEKLRVKPKGRTLGKIAVHLASIYRLFIADGFLKLTLNGQVLSYAPPDFLEAPRYSDPSSSPVVWRKEFNLDLGDGHEIRGWAGILAKASVTNAGFAVFRRGRLVIGSHGEGYRPEIVFGKPNKFVYQRLIGEFEVSGFSVSHTKDGIQWTDWEDDILAWLKQELDTEPLPLLQQAKHYRVRPKVDPDPAQTAAKDTSNAIAQHLAPVVDEQLQTPPATEPLEESLDDPPGGEIKSSSATINLRHANVDWEVSVEVIADQSRTGWYEIAKCDVEDRVSKLQIRMNVAHPFLQRFVSPGGDELIPFTRLATGLAIAEITARQAGVRQAGTVRTNLDQILRLALSGPTNDE